jgi:hypothetical protein
MRTPSRRSRASLLEPEPHRLNRVMICRRAFFAPHARRAAWPRVPFGAGLFLRLGEVPRQLMAAGIQRNSMASHHTGSDTDMLGFMSLS